jgi:putative phosphoesterase
MVRVGLLSDTHSYLDETIRLHLESCDEIWHAGDIGARKVTDTLATWKPLRAVVGNIDDANMRLSYPEDLIFTVEGVKVVITHIGGYPGHYVSRVRQLLHAERPKLYICGHSHILKVMADKPLGLLHMNPGAAGIHGFHNMRTLLRFTLEAGTIKDLEVVELGLRGAIKQEG